MLTTTEYDHWLAVARRHTHRADEAADLLHNALIAAMRAGRRDFASAATAAWFTGVIRNLAKMDARSAVRRKSREANHPPPAEAVASSTDEVQAWMNAVAALPTGARTVAVLALHGLDRKEIAHVLRLTDASLRQRLTSIRKAMHLIDASALPQAVPNLRSTFGTQLELGLLRRSLLAILQHEGDIGTHDPDGHLIVLTRAGSQKPMRRQQD